jgi:hypothetical protein
MKDCSVGYQVSDHENPSIYCSFMNNFVEELSKENKGIIFFHEDFVYGMIGNQKLLEEVNFKKFLDSIKKEGVEMKYKSQNSISVDKKKKISNVYQFMVIHKFSVNALSEYFKGLGFGKI